MWTPKLRCLPEQSMQKNTPRFTDAQSTYSTSLGSACVIVNVLNASEVSTQPARTQDTIAHHTHARTRHMQVRLLGIWCGKGTESLLPQSMQRLLPFSAMMASSTFFAAGVHDDIGSSSACRHSQPLLQSTQIDPIAAPVATACSC